MKDKNVEVLEELREDEEIVFKKYADYWRGWLKFPGEVVLTNMRMAWRNKALLGAADENTIELELREIQELKTCNIGNGLIKILPTGVKIITRNGEKYVLSLMNRKELISAFNKLKGIM